MGGDVPRILIAEERDFSPAALDLLRKIGRVTLADLGRDDLLRSVRDADVLWVRLRNRVDESVLKAAPALKIIVTPTTGLNHIDLAAADRRGILVLSLRGETAFLRDVRATAEHTIGLMLALFRRLPSAASHVREGGWERDPFRGSELYGKTIGIVGYGRLGRIVARYLAPFDVSLCAADPLRMSGTHDGGVKFVPLPDLLRQADIVTIHVNLIPETRRFFGREQFHQLKRGSSLVNTARGELIDEHALVDALNEGRLAGAALDVLTDEDTTGMSGNPLVCYSREHDNLIITPHIGGCTRESMEKTEVFLAERLLRVLSADASPPSLQRDV